MKPRNHALNFLKLFFLAVIVIHHSGIAKIPHGYIGVEFFFMTSGYFIYQTYLKKQSLTLAAYTKKRFFKLYPHYIFSFTAMAVFFFNLSANVYYKIHRQFSRNIHGSKYRYI